MGEDIISALTAGQTKVIRRARVDAFVARHFSFGGSLALHRSAIGLDLLRAPLNVMLAPVFLLTRLLGLLAGLARLPRLKAWFFARRILLTTAVARRVQTLLREELVAPEFRDDDNAGRLIEEYTGVRSAIAEITTVLFVLVIGSMVFRILTPGILSLAPEISGYMARSTAVAQFPLGRGLGGLWYWAFPVELAIWFVIAVGAALAMIGSLVTTFAGLLADPVQAALGIHRRRLVRLLDAIDRGENAVLAREHLLARAGDLSDLVLSLLRVFRP